MDADRFDTLARNLYARSRRRFLGSLSGLALGGALAPLLGLTDAEAKKKKKKKKKKKRPATPAPAPGCVAEGAAQTCAGRCGTWANSCGQAVACPSCPAGRDCLANGSCAKNCAAETDCGAESICRCPSGPGAEGQLYCVTPSGSCSGLPPCTSTAQCPQGQHCGFCSGRGRRCEPLCGCIDDSDCGGGQQCSGGVCATPPGCTNGPSCDVATECCSGSCAGFCDCSVSGQQCTSDTDCCVASRPCVGFVCRGG